MLVKLSERLYNNARDPMIKNDKHENVLWNVLNRYVKEGLKSSNSTGITLLFAPANGCPKEVSQSVLLEVGTCS